MGYIRQAITVLRMIKLSVHKIGGSTLRNLDDLLQCAQVMAAQAAEERCLFVFSALYGVTDQLQAALDLASAGNDYQPVLAAIKKQHDELLAAISDTEDTAKLLTELYADLERLLEGVRLTVDAAHTTISRIIAAGELMAVLLVAAMLEKQGMNHSRLEFNQSLVAQGDPLDAVVEEEASRVQLQAVLADTAERIIIIPGFVAVSPAGKLLTLGRNGSDYSAACLALVCAARRCVIWKAVDGVYTADPALVSAAELLPKISYRELLELSYFGAKVINGRAVGPLMAAQIPCEIRSLYRPEQSGTLVSDATDQSIKGISYLDKIALITIAGPGLRGKVGTAQRVFQVLAAAGISIIQIVQSSSEFSINLALREDQAEAAVAALETEFHFEQLHQQISQISSLPGQAVVSLVGDGLKQRRGVAARLLTAVATAGINVVAIAQGSSERAIALVVATEEAPLAIKACHDEFFADLHYLDVILLGCGLVGSELLRQIERQNEALAEQKMHIRVRAIANSQQLLLSDAGQQREIDLSGWQSKIKSASAGYNWQDIISCKSNFGLINPTIVDCTASPEVARQYVSFLDAGYNVVAANKHANTFSQEYYLKLRQTERQRLRKFLYETNVGAGLPFLDTVQALMRSGDFLDQFHGILSGSLSLIFGLLEDGISFSAAVALARTKGFTEPDPREDLSGMDVARKLLIIARETGMQLELEDVEVEAVIPVDFKADLSGKDMEQQLQQLDAEFANRVKIAAVRGQVLRYRAHIIDGRCQVGIAAVDKSDPLAPIRDGENALAMYTNYYSPMPMVLRGYGAGATVTAAGVFGDILRTLRQPEVV